MTRHSLSKEARKQNVAEQFAQFGLQWEIKKFLHNAPSTAAILLPNAYEITGRIRRRRNGFTYMIKTNDGYRSGHRIRAYELTYLDACERILEILGSKIAATQRALGGEPNKYNSISYSPGPNGTTITTVRAPDGTTVTRS